MALDTRHTIPMAAVGLLNPIIAAAIAPSSVSVIVNSAAPERLRTEVGS